MSTTFIGTHNWRDFGVASHNNLLLYFRKILVPLIIMIGAITDCSALETIEFPYLRLPVPLRQNLTPAVHTVFPNAPAVYKDWVVIAETSNSKVPGMQFAFAINQKDVMDIFLLVKKIGKTGVLTAIESTFLDDKKVDTKT
jgi:hypothetical protein